MLRTRWLPVLFLIILAMFLVGAGVKYKYTQSLGKTTDVWGSVTVPFNNYSGGYLKYGYVVKAATYTEGNLVVDTVANTAAATLTLADSLLNETQSMALGVYFYNASNCSMHVFGLDSGATAAAETLAYGTGDGWDYSAYRYSQLDSAKTINGGADDSLFIYAIPYRGVTTTASADDALVLGVVTTADSVADNGVVQVAVAGVAQVLLKAASTAATPGLGVETTDTAGYGIPVSSPTTAQAFGKCVDARGADGLVPVLLGQQ